MMVMSACCGFDLASSVDTIAPEAAETMVITFGRSHAAVINDRYVYDIRTVLISGEFIARLFLLRACI
jgi:hypothetical protein